MIGPRAFAHLTGEIVWQRVGEHEIAVRQSLHECAGAETICAMIGKVRFADHMQAGDVAHQIIVHPQAPHCVMDRRVNAHRSMVGIVSGDFFVDIEEVAVTLADGVFTETLDRVLEIEIDAAPARTNAATFIAHFLGAAGRISRERVAVARIFALEIIIASASRMSLGALAQSSFRFGTERVRRSGRFRHEVSRLVVAAHRDAGGVDLRSGIGKSAPFL
jgi:hypothetical protein